MPQCSQLVPAMMQLDPRWNVNSPVSVMAPGPKSSSGKASAGCEQLRGSWEGREETC